MYKLIRKILFLLPPEDVHYFSMNAFAVAKFIPGFRKIVTPAKTRAAALHTSILTFHLSILSALQPGLIKMQNISANSKCLALVQWKLEQ